MTPTVKIFPTTAGRIALGKAHPQQKQFRIMRDVTPVENVEFGFLPLIIPAIAGLVGGGAQVYGQIKSAEAQEKAVKAQAEAQIRAAQINAAARAETMRKLMPVLALTVVAGTLVTVILVKRKKKRGTT